MQSPLDFFYKIENIDPLEYYYNYATKEIVEKCDDPKKLNEVDFTGLIDDPCFVQFTGLKCIDLDDLEIIQSELQDTAEGALFQILSKEFITLESIYVRMSHEINKLSDIGSSTLKQLMQDNFPLISAMTLQEFKNYINEMDSLPLKDNLFWNIGFESVSEYTFKWKDYVLHDVKFYSDELTIGYVSIEDKIIFKYKDSIESTDDTPENLKLRKDQLYLYRHML
jgi:hypothetical protein